MDFDGIMSKVAPLNSHNLTSLINFMQKSWKKKKKVSVPDWAELGRVQSKLVTWYFLAHTCFLQPVTWYFFPPTFIPILAFRWILLVTLNCFTDSCFFLTCQLGLNQFCVILSHRRDSITSVWYFVLQCIMSLWY